MKDHFKRTFIMKKQNVFLFFNLRHKGDYQPLCLLTELYCMVSCQKTKPLLIELNVLPPYNCVS